METVSKNLIERKMPAYYFVHDESDKEGSESKSPDKEERFEQKPDFCLPSP